MCVSALQRSRMRVAPQFAHHVCTWWVSIYLVVTLAQEWLKTKLMNGKKLNQMFQGKEKKRDE